MKKKSKLTNDFSKQIDQQLHQISFREIKVLWNILGDLSLAKEDLVQKRFLQNGIQFFDVLDFLNNLGLLRKSKGYVRRNALLEENDDAIKFAIVRHLLNQATPYRNHLNEFFGEFKSVNGKFEVNMTSEKRNLFGGIRNLLLELDFIDRDLEKPRYWVAPQYLTEFFDARNSSEITPSNFQAILSARERLGHKAELEVLKYEAARLRHHPHWGKRIKHIAIENVCAGYDILSLTETGNSRYPSDRFIEVKAVSPIDFKFFWSRNEIEIARAQGLNYYLYLIPVSKAGFDLQKMKIIQNPFQNVYTEQDFWLRQNELVSFWSKNLE